MHRDTVTRSGGPLLCHSSTTITSCCSMIMHGPMLQESVHNSWKLKTSQFLHGQHTHRTCHPLSMFGMLWIVVYHSVFLFLTISSNFAQPLKRSGPTFHRPQSTTWSTLCEGDVLQCVRQMVVTPNTDWYSDIPNTVKLHILEWPFYCGQSKAHLCNNHAVSCSATHLLHIELIRLLIVACGMLVHFSSMAVWSYWIMSAETRAPRWAPETDLQWGLRHLDSHREKTTGTSGALTIWLCCSWNKLLVRLARGELAPRLSLVSPKVFFLCSVTDGVLIPLLLSPLACLVGDISFPAISPTWLHRYYLNWAGRWHHWIQ